MSSFHTFLSLLQVPGFLAWYNIVYDGDEAVYTYKLMQDYHQQTLEIIV